MNQQSKIKKVSKIFGLFMFSVFSLMDAHAQIVLHDATDVTQTKATLSADFPNLNVTHGFQYKYGTLPELDDFSRQALADMSDPVMLMTTGNAWSARTVKGWVESKSGLSAGQSSVMSATVAFTEETEISFEWSVDSEDGIGVLSFWVDGLAINSISGEVGFTTVTYTASAGAHTFQWQYKKSSATNVGLDIGMVRNINFQNTTEGEWLLYLEIAPKMILSAVPMLFPDRDYVYRAYQVVSGKKEYSSIKHFRTLPVTIDVPNVMSVTQSTVTIACGTNLGDAQSISQCGIITNSKIVPKLSSFDAALLDPSSDPVDIYHSNSLGIDSYKHDPGDTYYSDRGIWISYGNGNYIQADFTLYEDGVISFMYGAMYSCRFALYIDDVLIEELYNTSKSVSRRLGKGKHTIKWKYTSYASEGTARLYDLKVNGVDVSKLKNYNISYNPQLPTDTISLGTTTPLAYTMKDLSPLSRSNAIFFTEMSVGNQKEVILSNRIDFETLPVMAYTVDVENVMQASATIRGRIDGGDATIIAAGLQYKDAEGTRWTDFPKEVTDTLLAHPVTRLRPNTTYNYRSYIQAQDCDTVFSETGTFVTLSVEACKPVLINRSQHTAELQGKVIFGDASIYQRGMQFRKVGVDEWEEIEDGGTDSVYTLKKSGLELKTEYQARTYIQPAGSDMIYSDILDFQTKSVEIYIDSIKNIRQCSAVVYGKIDSEDESVSSGRINIYKFIDGKMSEQVKTVDISVSESVFRQEVTGLQPNTAYGFIAEVDYGDGRKSYSNVHESEMTEMDIYKKALLTPESSTDVVLTYDEDWEATEDGLYFDHYAYYDDLTATFTLSKAATISFEWSVTRSYAYNGNTSPDIELFVDGGRTALRSIAATANNKTYSSQVTLTLYDGEHSLTWRPYYTGKFYVRNLFIPNDATLPVVDSVSVFTTMGIDASVDCVSQVYQRSAVVHGRLSVGDDTVVSKKVSVYNGQTLVGEFQVAGQDTVFTQRVYGLLPSRNYIVMVEALCASGATVVSQPFDFHTTEYFVSHSVSDIAQTQAVLTAELSLTDDVYDSAGFILRNNTQAERSVAAVVTGNTMTANVNGLKPGLWYHSTPFVVVDGQTYYAGEKSFKSEDLDINIYVSDVTQTTAKLKVEYTEADAHISHLQYLLRIGDSDSDTDTFTDLPADGRIEFSGLVPGAYYEMVFAYELDGQRCYSYWWNSLWYLEEEQRWAEHDGVLNTLPVSFTATLNDVVQTSALARFSIDCGTATLLAYGIELGDTVFVATKGDSLRINELDFSTTYRYCPFIEIEEYGRIYNAAHYWTYQNRQYAEFTTQPCHVATGRPTQISNRSATMNGSIDCDGYSSAEFGFQWKQMEGWNSDPAFTKGVKNEDGAISVALVNGMLEPNTDYQYRAAVRYKGKMYYADSWETFRTESEYVYYPASVYTIFRTDREHNCLILCGYYVAGSETVTRQGYEYWYNQSNGRSYGSASTSNSDVVTVTTDESMQYSLDLNALIDGGYSVRAFVTTVSGTIYGETLTFNVQNQPSAIVEVENGDIRLSKSGTTLFVHHATSLLCSIYTLNGTCVARRKLTGDEEEFDLQQHTVYIIKFSNGMSFKIKL